MDYKRELEPIRDYLDGLFKHVGRAIDRIDELSDMPIEVESILDDIRTGLRNIYKDLRVSVVALRCNSLSPR